MWLNTTLLYLTFFCVTKINFHHHKTKQLLSVYLVSPGVNQNHGGSWVYPTPLEFKQNTW